MTNYVRLSSQTSSNKARAAELAKRSVISSSSRDTSHADVSPKEYNDQVEEQKAAASSESSESTESTSNSNVLNRYTTGYYDLSSLSKNTVSNQAAQEQKVKTGTLSSSGSTSLHAMTDEEIAASDAIPSPVSENYRPTYEYFYGGTTPDLSNPHSLGSDVTARTSITSKPKDNFSPETTSLTDEVSSIVTGAQKVTSSKGVTISRTSQKLIDVGDSLVSSAEEFKQDYKESDSVLKEISPGSIIVPYAAVSLANIGSMFSRVPAGVEVAVQAPELLPSALLVAGLGTVDYTVNTIKTDPLQLVTDLAVFSALGYGAGKAGSAIKSKIPVISTGEQGILLKTKLVESPTIPETVPESTITAEYLGKSLGKDVFDIQESVLDVSTVKPEVAGTDILIGKRKGEVNDVYFNIPESNVSEISANYYTKTRNIKTSEGSFLEVEITGKMDPVSFTKSNSPKISGPENTVLIGELSAQSPGKFKSPFRLEKRVDLQKGKLTVSDSQILQIPEATITLDSSGKVVSDFNIYDYYRNPDFEQNLQLGSGLVKAKKSFLASEEATLNPSTKYVQKEAFIGEMPEMNLKILRGQDIFRMQELYDTGLETSKNKLAAYKEPDLSNNDLARMQRLYDEAASRGSDPITRPEQLTRTTLERITNPERSFFPGIVPSHGTSTVTHTSNMPDLSPATNPFPEFEPAPAPSPAPAKPKPGTKVETKFAEALNTNIEALLEMPSLKKVKSSRESKSGSKKVRRKKSSSWEYDRLVNDWQNPLDIEVKF